MGGTTEPGDPANKPARTTEARRLALSLAQFQRPSDSRALVELAITALPFAALWILIWFALDRGIWPALLLCLPAAGFLVRLFMIQHDCGHGSFFQRRAPNDWTGRIVGVLTLTPYGLWRRTHAIHHASSGSLERRGHGDVHTLTVAEYRAQKWLGRMGYRLYRHPLVLFGIGPAYLFLVQHRVPAGLMRTGWHPWASAMGTNVAIVIVAVPIVGLIGIKTFLLVHGPIVLLAASAGVWLFFVQHQFEHTVWDRDGNWNWHDAALNGSSHYELPAVLRWFTASIGVHHVHHLSSRIPYYRLQSVLRAHPELRAMGRLTIADSLRCVRLVLWDEAQRRLVSFRDLSALPRAA